MFCLSFLVYITTQQTILTRSAFCHSIMADKSRVIDDHIDSASVCSRGSCLAHRRCRRKCREQAQVAFRVESSSDDDGVVFARHASVVLHLGGTAHGSLSLAELTSRIHSSHTATHR